MTRTFRPAIIAAALIAGTALTGCSSDSAVEEVGADAAPTCAIEVSDPWVKSTDQKMTGAFGVLTNTGDVEMVVVSASSPVAGMMEIHEVVEKDGEMVMQELAGGLVIPAGESETLAPGQNHLMLMQLPAPIEPGQTVEITMTCSDGGTALYTGVAKPFEGGEETYVPGMEGMEGMDASASPAS